MKIHLGQSDQVLESVAAVIQQAPEEWLGPRVVGLFLTWMFLGILFSQVERYFRFYPKDPLWIKVEVVVVVIASILKTAEETYITWDNAVVHAGNFKHTAHIGILPAGDGLWSHLLGLTATYYFMHRCWVLTDRSWILLGTFVILEAAIVVFAALLMQHYLLDPYYFPAAIPIGYPYLILMTFIDILITVVVTYKLLRAKKGFSRHTDQMMNRLIRLTWETALPPTVVAIVNMILYAIMGQDNLVFAAFVMVIPRLYVFSFMYTLNIRGRLRLVPGTTQSDGSIPWGENGASVKPVALSVISGRSRGVPVTPTAGEHGSLPITVHTETIAHVGESDEFAPDYKSHKSKSNSMGDISDVSSLEEEKTIPRPTNIGFAV